MVEEVFSEVCMCLFTGLLASLVKSGINHQWRIPVPSYCNGYLTFGILGDILVGFFISVMTLSDLFYTHFGATSPNFFLTGLSVLAGLPMLEAFVTKYLPRKPPENPEEDNEKVKHRLEEKKCACFMPLVKVNL